MKKYESRGDVITDVWKRRERLIRKIGHLTGRYVAWRIDRDYFVQTRDTLENQIAAVQNELTKPELAGMLLSSPRDYVKVMHKDEPATPQVIYL